MTASRQMTRRRKTGRRRRHGQTRRLRIHANSPSTDYWQGRARNLPYLHGEFLRAVRGIYRGMRWQVRLIHINAAG
jgi:hypothetical protein